MSTLTWLSAPRPLTDPVLVIDLTGWIDAGAAARTATEALLADCDADVVAVFDDDTYIDFRARRPMMRLVGGVNSHLDWSQITVSIGRDLAGHDVVVLHGPEPDMAWRRFIREVGDLARRLGVSSMVHLGAYPFATPHTRPSRLSITTPSHDVAARVPFLRSDLTVPAGVCAALEHELHDHGIASLGIWAQVPQYLANVEYPAAAVALLDGVRTAVDVVVDATDLRAAALAQSARFDALVTRNAEHAQMVQRLEAAHDSGDDTVATTGSSAGGLGEMSADDLGAEVERFLREQD